MSTTKSYLELTEEIQAIVRKYYVAKEVIENNINKIASKERDYMSHYYLFVDDVNQAFLNLDNLDKEIINNDFFTPCKYEWWKKYYSRSTYYRLKSKAMSEFLRCFYDQIQ